MTVRFSGAPSPRSASSSDASPPIAAADDAGVWTSSERVPSDLPSIVELRGEVEEYGAEISAWLAGVDVPAKWTPQEAHFLDLVRRDCGPTIERTNNYRDAYGDRRLLRFLRQWKTVPKALKAVKEYLAWRRDECIDAIRADLESRHDPRSWPSGAFILDRCCVLPCSTTLFDVKGNALCVEKYGVWPADRLRDVASDDYLRWQLYCLEWKSIQLERVAVARERAVLRAAMDGRRLPPPGWGEIARLCTVFDVAGMTFAHALLPNGLKTVRQLIPLVQANYPWLQDTTHIVHASSTMTTVFSMIKPLLPKHTQEKVFVHAADASLSLVKSIHRDFLPQALGGLAPCAALVPPPDPDGVVRPSRSLSFLADRATIGDVSAAFDDDADFSDDPTTPSALTPTGRDLLDHLDAGGKILVYKHSRRGRSRRYLTVDDAKGLVALSPASQAKGRFFRRRSPKIIATRDVPVFAAPGKRGSRDASGLLFEDAALEPWQAKINDKAARLPPNFAVVATADGAYTLELESEEAALVLTASILKPHLRRPLVGAASIE